MNKTLAFCQRRIPYIPELRALCEGSVNATIVFQQLEYWFASHPEGFYKFLSPCAHPECLPGDTWVEELMFSEKEFRAAFDHIGVRYKSLKQAQSAPDPFQGKMYFSYTDAIARKTYYRRNHDLVDTHLTDLVGRFKVRHSARDAVTHASKARGHFQKFPRSDAQVPKSPLPNLQNGSYVIAKLAVGYNKEAEITTKITAAASKSQEEKGGAARQNHSAAAFLKIKNPIPKSKLPGSPKPQLQPAVLVDGDHAVKSPIVDSSRTSPSIAIIAGGLGRSSAVTLDVEPIIGATLTKRQCERVKQTVAGLVQASVIAQTEVSATEHSFALMLLSDKHFTGAGRDFVKKLNTLNKMARLHQISRHEVIADKTKVLTEHEQAVQKLKTQIGDHRRLMAGKREAIKKRWTTEVVIAIETREIAELEATIATLEAELTEMQLPALLCG